MTDATTGSVASLLGSDPQATPTAPGAPGASDTSAPGATAAAAPDWLATLDEGRRGYVEKKGFKDPAAVLDSYQNLEKMMGDPKSLIKFPKHDAKPEEVSAFESDLFNRLGRPEKAEAYKFPEGVDAETVKVLAPELHKIGITQKQAEALATLDINRFKQSQEVADRQYKETLANDRQALKAEWGANTDKNTVMADQAIKAAGLNDTQLEAMTKAVGLKTVMGLLQKFGSVIGEDNTRIFGDTPAFQMSTARAREEIRTLRGDATFMKQYMEGNKDARARMEGLQQRAHPGVVGGEA